MESELRALKRDAKALEAERKNTARQQGGLSGMKNKYELLDKKKVEAETRLEKTQHLLTKEQARSKKLAETLRHYEQHLESREESLDEKERTILSLRSTNRTLDNFRFVLDHRLTQLKEEKGPLTQHIEGLEQHVHKMYEELVKEHSKKKELHSVIERKDTKMATQQKELTVLRSMLRDRDRSISAFSRSLSMAVALTIPKEIEDAVKDMYREHVKGEKGAARPQGMSSGGEAGASKRAQRDDLSDDSEEDDADDVGGVGGGGGGEAAREVRRQRDYMQKTVATLKKSLKQVKSEAAARGRIAMAENSLLISECNHLRKEGRKLRMQLDQATQQIHIERQKLKRLAMEKHVAASTSTTTVQEIETAAEPAAESNDAAILKRVEVTGSANTQRGNYSAVLEPQ